MVMDVMVSATLDEILRVNQRLRKAIEDADPASLDWRPGSDTCSLAVLAVHALGSQEFLVGVAVGATVPRDRAAEFRTAAADKAALLERIDQVNERVRGWLQNADISLLAEMKTTPRWQRTGVFCVALAIAHTAEHLGHVELTYQLWSQSLG